MKKLLAIAAAATALFAITPIDAEAGTSCYRSKILHRCGHCHRNVYAYYRPIRYISSRAVYGWVPSYHSSCATRRHYSVPYHHRGGLTLRFSTGSHYHSYRNRSFPSYRSFSALPSYRYRSYGYCR